MPSVIAGQLVECGLARHLAAASAAKGDFPAAVKWQNQTLERTLTVDSDKKPADLRTRLELYQAAKPYREPAEWR